MWQWNGARQPCDVDLGFSFTLGPSCQRVEIIIIYFPFPLVSHSGCIETPSAMAARSKIMRMADPTPRFCGGARFVAEHGLLSGGEQHKSSVFVVAVQCGSPMVVMETKFFPRSVTPIWIGCTDELIDRLLLL